MSNDLQLKLTLKADGRQLSGVLKNATGDVVQFGQRSEQAAQTSAQAFGKTRAGVQSISEQLQDARHQLLAFVGVSQAFSAGQQMVQTVASYQDMTTKLEGLSTTAAAFAENEQYLIDLSQEHHKNLLTLGDGYSRILSLEEAQIVSREQGRAILEGLSNASSRLGASNVQLEQSLYGLAQGLSAGTLRAEELNQITEPLPGLLQALDRASGQAAGGFRQLVNDGQVTSDMFRDILIVAFQDYEGAAASTADNLSAKFTDVQNSYTLLARSLEQPVGNALIPVLDGISDGTRWVSENTEELTTVLGVTLVTAATRSAGAFAVSTAATVKDNLAKRAAVAEELKLAQAQSVATAAALRHAQAQTGLTVAHGSAAKAAEAHRLATQRLAVAQAATRGAGRALLGLLGGPVGLAITAGLTAAAFIDWGDSAKTAADGTDWLKKSTEGLTKAQLEQQLMQGADIYADAKNDLEEYQSQIDGLTYKIERYQNNHSQFLPSMQGDSIAIEQWKRDLVDAKAEFDGASAEAEKYNQKLAMLEDLIKRANSAGPINPENLSPPPVPDKTLESFAKLTATHNAQIIALELGARAQYEYQLQQKGLEPQLQQTLLAQYDYIEGLKERQKAEKEAADAAQKAEQQAQRQSDLFVDRINQYNAEIIALTEGTRAKLAYDLAQQGYNETQIETLLALDDRKTALEAQQAADEEAAKAQAKTTESIAANTVTLTTLTEQAADRIDSAFSDAWANIDDGFGGLVDGIQSAFTQMLAEMAHEALTKPIILNVQQSLSPAGSVSDLAGLVGSAGNLGAGSAGAGPVGPGLGGAAGAAGSAGISMASGAIAAGALVTVAAINAHNKADDEQMKKYTAEYRQGVQSTGTVLGDINAKSHSVSELTAELVDMNTDVLSVNFDMLTSLRAIESGIAGVSTGMARQLTQAGGLEDYSGSLSTSKALDTVLGSSMVNIASGALNAAGLGIVGDFVGGLIGSVSSAIYSKKKSLQDAGIEFADQTLGYVIDGGFVSAQAYQRIKTTRRTFGIKSSSSSTTRFDLDDSIQYQLGDVFGNAASVLADVAGEMDIAGRLVDQSVDGYIRSLTIDKGKLSLKGLKGDELSAEIEAYISSNLDRWASQMLDAADLSGWVEQYQEAGEGVFQTLGRLTAQSRAFQATADRLGLQFDVSGLASAELTQSLADLAGGFDQLQSQTAAYYQNYFSEAEQQAHLQQQLTVAFADLNQTLPASKAEFRSLVESLDLTTESGQQTYARLMRLQGVFSDYADEMEKTAQSAIEAAAAIRAAQNQQISDAVTPYLQSLADWSSAELSRIESDYRERIALAEQQMRIGRELRQYVEQLKISDLSPYDPGEKLQLASAAFAKLLVRAESGDLDAAGQLQSAANAYLQNADSYYGRSDPYTAIFEDVSQSLDQLGLDIMGGLDGDSVGKLNAQMLSEQQRIRDYAREQLDWTVSQYDALTSISQLLELLPETLASQLGSITGTAAASAASSTEDLIKSQWDQMGGGTYSNTDLSSYASAIDSGAADMRQINQELAYYQNNNSKVMDQVLALWELTGGGDYNEADLADYSARIVAGTATLSAGDLEYYRTHGSHADGLNSVPFDGYKAELHKNEMVLTADVANHIRESMNNGSTSSQVIVQTDPALLAEIQQLRAQVERLESEQRRANGKAEQQRTDQQRATESVARAAKPPVGVL